jgi:ribosomal protein L11 methyltransferase
MNYLQFDFEIDNEVLSDTLVAILSNYPFEGFEEIDGYLKAFIAETDYKEQYITEVAAYFPSLQYILSVVENINWNKQWEENFQPVTVDDFVAVRAHFHLPITHVQHEIIITPKMSFGTGHHATTYMMLQAMQHIDFTNKKVVDFGTGTGVLAILASKLGATSILAIDYDEWSIENAKENLMQNNTPAIELLLSDTLLPGATYDIILANINLNIILNNMASIATSSKTGSIILLSGFLKDDEVAIKNALINNDLKFVETFQSGEWIAIKAVR